MCAIAGLLDARPQQECLAILSQMLTVLSHRGPEGIRLNWAQGLGLGQCRLAFQDLNGGEQPLISPCGRYAAVLNGEIYNVEELRSILRQDGATFRSRSDVEVVLELYRRRQQGFVHDLDGMFAIAIHDRWSGRVVLARDRFGEKPLYLATPKDGLTFASELSAILVHPDVSRTVERRALLAFLQQNAVPAPATLIEGVRKLEPGTLAVYEHGVLTITRYWIPPIAAKPASDRTAARAELKNRLRSAVRNCLTTSQTRLGVLLSGGLDSSLITAMIAEIGSPAECFSVGFSDGSFDETRYARLVAQTFGARHEVLVADDRLLGETARAILYSIDEPLADPSLIPLHALARVMRRSVKGALGGDGADDLFMGYPFYSTLPIYTLAETLLPTRLTSVLRRADQILGVSERNMHPTLIAGQLARGLRRSDAARFVGVSGAFDEEELHHVLTPSWRDAVAPRTSLWSGAPAWPGVVLEKLSHAERVQAGMLRHFLSDQILTKCDRAGMAHGLEIRSPFLSRDVADFVLGLTGSDKGSPLSPKRILREVAQEYLPPVIVKRRKQGFRMPLARLLRTELAVDSTDILLGPASDVRLFDSGAVRRLLDEHVNCSRDHQKKLWSMICAQSWFSRLQTMPRPMSNLASTCELVE